MAFENDLARFLDANPCGEEQRSLRESTLCPGHASGDGRVAFGHESDITSEAADAVILERSLAKVEELMHIGRRMRRIALQSAVGGVALSAAGMLLAAYGILPPIGGAIAQEVIDLVAVLNAVRVALPFGVLRDC
jgi:cation transport ATPase